MADEMPIFPKAGVMYLQTGNIVQWNRLKMKPRQSSTDEVKACLEDVLKTWLDTLSEHDRTNAQYSTELECINEKNILKLENERTELKLTAKIYLSSMDPNALNEAFERVKHELGVSAVDVLLVSVPVTKDLDFASFQPVWEAMEALYDNESAFTIGVADFNQDQLEQLYNWAKIKPEIDQVTLQNCCFMPPELKEYAHDRDIQLLTHNDPTEILPAKTFQKAILSRCTERDSENWQSDWVVRYSSLIKGRGIIRSKGYIVKGIRDTKQTK